MKQEQKDKISKTYKERGYKRTMEHKQRVSEAIKARTPLQKRLAHIKSRISLLRNEYNNNPSSAIYNKIEKLEYELSLIEEEMSWNED